MVATNFPRDASTSRVRDWKKSSCVVRSVALNMMRFTSKSSMGSVVPAVVVRVPSKAKNGATNQFPCELRSFEARFA